MPIPRQTLMILDPGLGVVDVAPTPPLVLGVAELGTNNVLVMLSRKTDVLATFGQGPLSEAACKVLDVAGGPVPCCKLNGSVVGTFGAVTKVGTGTGTVTVAGVPYNAYEVQVRIVTVGTLGTATFQFSLDDGNTWSSVYLIPGGGVFVLPSTGLTLTFVPGAGPVFFAAGDFHWFDCVAPYYATADLANAVTALLALTTEYPFIILTGRPASAAGGATMFGAVETHAASFAAANRYTRWMMDAGNDTTGNVITSFGAVDDRRVSVWYGTTDIVSSKPFEGWGVPALPSVVIAGAWAAAALISTDLARVRSGALTGVLRVSHDEALNEVLDVARISTTRSIIGYSGFFITNGRLKSQVGSDFRYWQHGRIMDVACRTVFIAQQGFLSIGLRTTSTGTIDERDATRLESIVNAALREQLTAPSNAEGTRGHVSAITYRIDRTNNLQLTEILQSEVAVRPLGYSKEIVAQLGFALEA